MLSVVRLFRDMLYSRHVRDVLYFQTMLFLVDFFNMHNRNITRRLVLGNSGGEIFLSMQSDSKKKLESISTSDRLAVGWFLRAQVLRFFTYL